jgi:hypothetical protein
MRDLRARATKTENSPRYVDFHRQNSIPMNTTDPKTTEQMLEPLLDEKAAARFLFVADGTPGNWRRATPPVGPAYVLVEGVVRYAPADLRAYVELQRRDPRAGASP